MKIAFVVPGFSADEGDWCIPAHTDIVKTLAQSDEVHVYTLRYPHRVDNYRIGEAQVHSFNGVGSRGRASLGLWKTVLGRIAQEHRSGRFDLVHAIFGSESGAVAVMAGKWLRIPSVVWLVNGELTGLRDIGYGADLTARQRWMNDLILRYADRILCGCDTLTRTATARNSHARVVTLPLGVNTRRFAPETSGEPQRDPLHFVNVGSLSPVKDQATLLEAFARIRRNLPDARLTIAGVGTLESALRAQAAALGIAGRVTFAGNIPHDRLASLYASANVFVQSSRHEGQGMALLEAAACGCAVCGTNVGIFADLAHREDASIVVPPDRGAVKIPGLCAPGDPEGLAKSMLFAFQWRVVLAPRVQHVVSREYNLETIGARLRKVYRELSPAAFPSGQTLADA